jgi:sortase A
VGTRRLIGIGGRAVAGAGALVLLFVVYQLWGTGILEGRHQSALRQQFEIELRQVRAAPAPPAASATSPPADPATLLPAAAGSPPAEGQPVGLLQIPKIGLDVVVVEGTSESDLSLGPGLYPGAPLPGQVGNSAIAGHRTTFGAPFYSLSALGPGDAIYVTTLQGRFHFSVTASLVVSPSDDAVVAPTPFPELTLTTCDPPFSATYRLVVHARLVGRSAPPPPSGSGNKPSAGTGRSTVTRVKVPVPGTTSGAGSGSSGWLGAVWWGLGLLALGVAVWLVARRRRRAWAVYLASVPLLLVPLFFFFEGISSLVPPTF